MPKIWVLENITVLAPRVLEFGPIITVHTPDPGNSENISGILSTATASG